MLTSDLLIPKIVVFFIVALIMGLALRTFRIPSVVAYIITGLLLGPFGFSLITDEGLIANISNFGVILLLFFVGMEFSINEFISKWKLSIIGTLIQVIISVLVMFGIGLMFGWHIGRIILTGFVISLSSTAVIIKILENKGELKSKIGQDVLSILLIQDLAIIPMVIIITYFGGEKINSNQIILQIIGCILIIGFIVWLLKNKNISIPFVKKMREDPEFQILLAFIIGFGFAAITSIFGLSAALGAFIGGVFISSTKDNHWIHETLQSFKVIFLAAFFISIGIMVNLNFLFLNIGVITLLLLALYLTNTLINAIIFKLNGDSWKTSLYGGALLSQIGEFSFILVQIGLNNKIIQSYAYNLTISVIALSLMISPMWIGFFSKLVDRTEWIIKNDNIKKILRLKIKENQIKFNQNK